MTTTQNTEHPEPSNLVYDMFLELIKTARDEMDHCEKTPDPAEARYKFDVAIQFTEMLETQVMRVPDAIERRTCERQMKALQEEMDRIKESIPYICQQCRKPWLPEDRPKNELCQDCEDEAKSNANGPENNGHQKTPQ